MDISGLIQSSFDGRAASTAPLTRTMVAPQYIPHHPYTTAPSNNVVAPHQNIPVQHNPFGYNAYTSANINVVIPAYPNNYIQQRPLPRLAQPESYARNSRQGFVEELQSQSPPIKSEPQWNTPTESPTFGTSNRKNIAPTTSADGSNDVSFVTGVDTLMKAIQAKSQSTQPQKSSPNDQSRPVVGVSRTPPYVQSTGATTFVQGNNFKLTKDSQDDAATPKGGKKRYQCTFEGCGHCFYQKTHLDIHERKHTGVKPYNCPEPNCGRSFSQLGNLKTHERRHTGERPFQCDHCGKKFAQRGNVRAHKIVHDQAKPYLCRLDKCGKQFTQLGNLKSHQNKFHAQTIEDLTSKFASIKTGDIVSTTDKELWEYFANLYKNSNKGIKGRGKDRKVGSSSSHAIVLNSGMRNLGVSSGGRYASSAGRGSMVVGVMGAGMGGNVKGEGQYEMFDVDDESGSHSGSGGASSVASGYDDAPCDGYEDTGRGADLAFGDRIY